ncbi:hypothetical protein CEXT_84221 [Caerostris extrusa]|uniref:Uncharacterized protein n=1 Tax=Caerostris extrusa TaxID=172846 RepID=A0AAV4MTJ4_CAEEX|nr:hypothetical protein CEXT_84221 [Caerostris extrusa]
MSRLEVITVALNGNTTAMSAAKQKCRSPTNAADGNFESCHALIYTEDLLNIRITGFRRRWVIKEDGNSDKREWRMGERRMTCMDLDDKILAGDFGRFQRSQKLIMSKIHLPKFPIRLPKFLIRFRNPGLASSSPGNSLLIFVPGMDINFGHQLCCLTRFSLLNQGDTCEVAFTFCERIRKIAH